MKKEETAALRDDTSASGSSLRRESDLQEAQNTLRSFPDLFSEEERKELDSLSSVYRPQSGLPDQARKTLLQAAPERQPEWWKEMYLAAHPARRIVAEWAVRCYGVLIRDLQGEPG